MTDEIVSAGQRPPGDRAVGAVVKDYGPATKTSISNLSTEEIKNLRSSYGDPLAGHIVQEGTDAARKLLAANEAHVQKLREGPQLRGGLPTLEAGDKVYHKRKKKECTVTRIVSKKIVKLMTSEGKYFEASIDNVVKL